jgi:predicted nucleotidyltransferase
MSAHNPRVIPAPIRSEILRRIEAAEQEHGVRVLLAVESGSRAWGFESPNSDYDARFIYLHPAEWYLSVDLEDKRDVIEYPIVDEIDLNGWDIRKALRLFSKSNPAFVEWIQSPLVYVEHGSFANRVRSLLPAIYSCAKGVAHYRSMAKTNYRGYLQAEQVPLKKYFYVLRPLLAVKWLERYGTPAPIEFSKLLHLIDDEPRLLADVHALLERKRSAPEMGLAPPIPAINTFIERELDRLAGRIPDPLPVQDAMGKLNDVFRDVLRE